MAFFGKNYFKDLLHYSDDHTLNDNSAIQQNYQLQRRLTDFFANNDKVQLLKSKKNSGEVNLLGDKSPLGGPIDWNLNGIRNVPSHTDGGCPLEFPFWSFNNKEGNNQVLNPVVINKINPIEQKKLIEKFTDNKENFTDNKENFTVLNQKENFDTKNNLLWIILIIVVPILIFFIIYYLSKPSQPEYLMSYY